MDIEIRNEEDLIREREFHKYRKMFYFDNKTGDIRFPSAKFVDMSHKEWFDNIKVDIKKVIRGFYDGFNVYCYIGNNFDIPNISVNQVLQLKSIFNFDDVYLGMNAGKIGTTWAPIMEINVKYLVGDNF